MISGILFALIFRKYEIPIRKYEWENEEYQEEEDEFMKHFDEDGNFIESVPDEDIKLKEEIKIIYRYKEKDSKKMQGREDSVAIDGNVGGSRYKIFWPKNMSITMIAKPNKNQLWKQYRKLQAF